MNNLESTNPKSESSTLTTHNSDTAGSLFRDFVAGAFDEVKNHPGKLAIEAGVGAAIAAGALLAAPEIAAGIAIAGTAAGIYELGKGVIHFADDAKIIDNASEKFSAAELAQAHREVRGMGASSMDSLAFGAGGIVGFEASRIATGFAGFGSSPYPFVAGVHFRAGLYTAGIGAGALDFLKKAPSEK